MHRILQIKMTIFPIGTAVDTTHLQPGDILHLYLSFYNVTSIHGFTEIIVIVCAKTIILWIFLTTSNQYPVIIIRFILNFLNKNIHEKLLELMRIVTL